MVHKKIQLDFQKLFTFNTTMQAVTRGVMTFDWIVSHSLLFAMYIYI